MTNHQNYLPEEPEWIFPYAGMDVGNSFFIPTMRPAKLIYVVDSTAKKHGIKVKTFITNEKGFLGLRIWRVG
jgi:hypothetical protein